MVEQALAVGYRLIDTAAAYGNEAAVGRAIKNSGIPRSELFITSKLWITETSYEGAKKGLAESLARLGLDYLDLFVIHQPYNDYYGAWRAMTELYRSGKVRAIGVDNFNQSQLADLIAFNEVKPAVNLVEANVFYQRHADQVAMKTNDVQMEAWSPFAAGTNNVFTNDILLDIANRYEKSVSQVILRWLLQRGVVSIPKSANIARMKQNLAVFDFEISLADMKMIMTLDTGESCFPQRNTFDQVTDFLTAAEKL